MPAGQLDKVISHLRRVSRLARDAERSDAELLERFIAQQDEEAFELLVGRHGPMVLGVCKRVLRNEADAEDAFQATLVVFVRKATSIIPRANVGNWLYGVAHKTALKAKAMSRRRRLKEQQAGAAAPRNAVDNTWTSLLEILDDELSLLPEKYRSPIVLCDLEGLSYREAAARLGCAQGTISGRLTRARRLLARRLSRRGLTLSAGTLASLLAQNASASLSPSLMAFAKQVPCMLSSKLAVKAIAMSPKVALLAEGVLKMMLLSKIKTMTGALLLVAAVVAAGWTCAAQAITQDDAGRLAKDDTPTPAPKAGPASHRTDTPEARFVFRAGDKDRKTVSLVVAGTSGPVLCLPVKADRCVLVQGRYYGTNRLRPGARVALRMDSSNGVIEEIQLLEEVSPIATLKNSKDLKHVESPSTAEVLRAMPPVARGMAAGIEVFRDEIQVVTERLVDKTDPPRFFPLVGQGHLHHCHWKCTVYYSETAEAGYPFPFRAKRPRVEVVYIDKSYLIPAGGPARTYAEWQTALKRGIGRSAAARHRRMARSTHAADRNRVR